MNVETVAINSVRLLGWEPKTDPLDANDPVLLAMLNTNRLFQIPCLLVAVGDRWQLWEMAPHCDFWKIDNLPEQQQPSIYETE